MPKTSIQLAQAKRKFNGKEYILTKINYTEAEAKEDETYYTEHGRATKILEEDGFWLLYTKIGQ